ncbi:MAG: DUF512 domain-containing protein [Anaerolineae bacterium]|nr:DUF512 domain-containing protein [Anaerolineae bacterium]
MGLHFRHPTFDIDIRRCNNLCPFCFVLQMAPRMRRTLYIKDDDYRYSFLFGHYVTLTNLSEHDWWRIKAQHLSPLYVSVHATDLAKRRECLRNPNAPDVLVQLRELAALNFEVHTQMVITPGLNDGPALEQSIRDLAALYPTVASISVVPVGLTRYHKYGHLVSTPQQAVDVLETVEHWQAHFRATLGLGLVYCTDEYYLVTGRPVPPLEQYDGLNLHENGLGMVRAFQDEWAEVQQAELPGLRSQVQRATLVTGKLAEPVIRQAAGELAAQTGLALEVLAVENRKLGETITAAGLLMGEDVLLALQALPDPGQLIVLPRVMFDHPEGVSLDDVSPLAIAKALNRPVALADWMGDVLDALVGQNKLTFLPDQAQLIRPDDIALDGGWAVEKYL